MTRSAAADLHNHVNRLHKYSDKLLLITCLKNTKTLTFPKCKFNTSLRTADVFPVVASFPAKERSDDRKYVCRSQAESTRKKCCFSVRESSCKLCREHTYCIPRIAFPRLIPSLELSPLSPSSLPFISSLSS